MEVRLKISSASPCAYWRFILQDASPALEWRQTFLLHLRHEKRRTTFRVAAVPLCCWNVCCACGGIAGAGLLPAERSRALPFLGGGGRQGWLRPGTCPSHSSPIQGRREGTFLSTSLHATFFFPCRCWRDVKTCGVKTCAVSRVRRRFCAVTAVFGA
jgi:hypothetical protein